MVVNLTLFKNRLSSIGMGLLLGAVATSHVQAQCGFLVGQGCSNTDYSNFGYNSNINAATIEYDNFVSAFHATLVRDSEGKLHIWGERTAYAAAGNNSPGNLTAKTEINATNYPGLTGTPLKATMASVSSNGTSNILLTTTGLFAWGTRGSAGVLANSGFVTASHNQPGFVKMTIGGQTNGLPAGVNPADVKMLFSTSGTLALVTCNGAVWVLSQNGSMRGNNNTGDANTWSQVKTGSGATAFLTNVVAVRGNSKALIALTSNNTVFTWGSSTLLGTETVATQTARVYATQMTLPESNALKMIGATTTSSGGSTYYLLYANGRIYAMGNNASKELGDFTTTASPSSATRNWVRPQYTNTVGDFMNNIVWISPNEHDQTYAAINVINANGRLWNWGNNAGSMLGRSTGTSGTFDPGQPLASATLTSRGNYAPTTSVVLGVETGGHTTMIANQCEANFGYVGHATNGSAANTASTNYTTFTFATTSVNICGAEGAPNIEFVGIPVLGSNGYICAGQSVTLSPTPSGGTLTVASGPATLSGNNLTFTANSGSIVLNYTVATVCGPQTATRTIDLEACPMQYITGSIWLDNNRNAVYNAQENGTNGVTSNNSGLWANLLNNAGEVVASVPIQANGSYSIPALASLTGSGFSVEVTKSQTAPGVAIPAAAAGLPSGWAFTGNNNASNVACVVPSCTAPQRISGITLSGTGSTGNEFGIAGTYNVAGSVFHDANGLNNNAVDGTNIYASGTPYTGPQLYIAAVDHNGNLLHYVPVTNTGAYAIDVPVADGIDLILTTNPGTIGDVALAPAIPSAWAYAGESFGTGNASGTGINNGTGTGTNAPATRYDGRINVVFPGAATTITGVNFGIQQRPTAQAKTYNTATGYFVRNAAPAAGFPLLGGYKGLPMTSAGLVEANNSSNGSLSGTDPEDCPTGNCNGNGGSNIVSSFTIGTINANTKLYYNFGAGAVEVTNGTSIPNFDITRMVIYGANGQGTAGNSLGFTYALTDKSGTTSPMVAYTITTNEALPLVLLSFAGHAEAFTSVLDWSTSKEENVSHFEVYRSLDGNKWNNMGIVKAQNIPLINNYNFVDKDPAKGLNFYQLFMKDLDGTGSYSKVITINHNEIAKNILLAPNPVTDQLNITLQGFDQEEEIHIGVYSTKGSVVMKPSKYESKKTISIDMAHLSAGVYLIEVKTKTDVYTYKVVKQ